MPQFDGVAGLSRSQLVGERGELPAFMALPGRAAAARLERECPDAVPFAEITGDLCFERLRLSARMRREYRRALGIGPARRLVAVTSTWLPHSLFARWPSLPERLLAALPMDDYAVAFVPHPNILSVHGGMESLFRRSLENGLIMVEPDEGWRAVVLAADAVIGDHGSVTFYAAALGIPTAVAAFGFAEMPSESPLAAFGKAAPTVDPKGDLLAQVEGLCESSPLDSECFAQALAESDPGPAERITAGLYRVMELERPEPPRPKMFAPAAPVEHWRPTSAWRCAVEFDGGEARWRRFPADQGRAGGGHLVADVGCLDGGVRDAADIVIRHGDPLPEVEARAEAGRLLAEHPMAETASVRIGPDRMVWCGRDGRTATAVCPPAFVDAAPSVWLAAGRPSRRVIRLHHDGVGTLTVSAYTALS
jgi:hypothetical protein